MVMDNALRITDASQIGFSNTELRLLTLFRDRASDAVIRRELAITQERALEMVANLRACLDCRLDETLREAAKRCKIKLLPRWI